MNIFEQLFGGGQPEISPQHEALRAVRFTIQSILGDSFKMLDLLHEGPETQVVGVCQYPERECETVYIMGASGNIVRVRIDGAPQESAEEFMAGEPAIEYHSIRVPNDPGELLNGDKKL